MILVTGGSGFLGQHLVKALSMQANYRIIALYYKNKPQTNYPNVTWLSCNLLDYEQLKNISQNVKYIYHTAAIVSFDPKEKKKMIHDNWKATQNIVNLSIYLNINKLIHISSVAALGRNAQNTGSFQNPITENSKWINSKHNSSYAVSKYTSEMEVWKGLEQGLNAAIINPGIIIGAGNWETGSANLVKVVYGEFPWYTSGINAWVDVKDVVKAAILLMESSISGERFILNAQNLGYKDIFTRFAIALDKKPPHRKANKWMTEFVWRVEQIKSRLAKKRAMITKETARTAQTICCYSNEKFLIHFPEFKYTSVNESVERIAQEFLKENPT